MNAYNYEIAVTEYEKVRKGETPKQGRERRNTTNIIQAW